MKESAKGFYRQGICNMKLNNLDQAKECFKKTLDLDSSIEGEIKKYLS